MTSNSTRCNAITNTGKQCRILQSKNGFCTYHYNTYVIKATQINNIENLEIESKNHFKVTQKVVNETLRNEVIHYESGVKKSEVSFDEWGKEDGIKNEWYQNGNKKSQEIYVHGLLNGIKRSWYENGNIDCICTWKDGRKSGIEIIFGEFADKCIYYINIWENGKLVEEINGLNLANMQSILNMCG